MKNTEVIGWPDGTAQFDFLDLYQCGINAIITFNGRKLCLECECNPAKIRWDGHNGEVIATYNTEEDFYNATICGKSIQEIVDEMPFNSLELF